MTKNKKSIHYLFALIVSTILLSLCCQRSLSSSLIIPTLESTPLPAINLPLLSQPTKRFTQEVFKGQVSLLNIWASSCSACQLEQPILMAIKKNYSTPIYGINFEENIDDAKAWLKSEGNPYVAVGADENGTLSTVLDLHGIPETIVVDKHGMIRYRYLGALTIEAWEGTLLPIIEQLTHEQ